MPGKAKTQKHTAKDLAAKTFAATVNRGGGSDGLKDRLGGKAGHAKFQCPLCGQQAPSIKSMSEHHASKHPKAPFDEAACVNTQAIHGATTVGVGVRGSKKGPAAVK